MFRLEIKITFSIFLITAFFSNNTYASNHEICQFQNGIFTNANRLYKEEQFLLSSSQYLLLFNSKCKGLMKKSRYNYSLSMANLGEYQQVIYQYVFFKKNDFSEAKDIKEIIEFSSNDRSNKKVNLWNNLDKSESRNKIIHDYKELSTLYEDYLTNSKVKNPYLAATLSAILPGAGQAYNGAYQSGVIALILNSLFLFSTIELANNNLDFPAIASGMVFSVTYLGNIMNAARGANNINQSASLVPKNKIKQVLFPVLNLKY